MTEKNEIKKRNKKKKSKKPKKSKSKLKKFLKTSLFIVVFLILTLGVTAAGYGIAIIRSTPPINVDLVKSVSQGAIFYDKNGEKNDNLKTGIDREQVKSEDIPKELKDAFVSIEDERFYEHQGIDVKRIFGALIHDIEYFITRKGGLHGASTMTQQLLKNTILLNEKSKIERKVKEIYLALQLEKQLSKDEILTCYLNTIPLGGTVYGVQAASERYFKKSVSELNLIECAYIAGVTQSPGLYDAFNPRHKDDPSIYIKRTKTVIGKMFELGKITQEEKDQAISDLDNGKLVFEYSAPNSKLNYEDYNRAALDQVKNDLKEKLKYSDEEVNKLVNQGGLHIYTNMDQELQNEVQEVVNDRSNLGISGKDTVDKDGVLELQAAATIVDPKTGEVKALVGGRGDRPAMSNNFAYSTLKSVGSAVKPLSVYAPAIDLKLMNPGSVFDDAPLTPAEIKRMGNNFQNQSRNFSGYLTMDKALAVSNNVYAVKTVDKIGAKNALAYGERFGLKYGEGSRESMSALALGEFYNKNGEDGGNTFLLASAYGAFANGGVLVEPMLYSEVKDASGKVLLKAEPTKTQVVSPETAYIIYDMLKGSSASTGTGKVKNIPTAVKTGTTTGNKNYWASGLTPYYSGAVWIGYDKNPRAMSGSSTATAGKLFGKVMNPAHKGLDGKDIPMPKGVIKSSVCMDSGSNPTSLCSSDPRGSRVKSFLMVAGSQPKDLCTVHVTAEVNKVNGKLANDKTPAALRESRVFIKKENPNPATADYKYVLPTQQDDMSAVPEPEVPPTNPDGETVVPPEDGGTPPTGGGTTTPPPPTPTPPPTPPTPPGAGDGDGLAPAA